MYPTHFSISVYHIIVSCTTLSQDLAGNLAGRRVFEDWFALHEPFILMVVVVVVWYHHGNHFTHILHQ